MQDGGWERRESLESVTFARSLYIHPVTQASVNTSDANLRHISWLLSVTALRFPFSVLSSTAGWAGHYGATHNWVSPNREMIAVQACGDTFHLWQKFIPSSSEFNTAAMKRWIQVKKRGEGLAGMLSIQNIELPLKREGLSCRLVIHVTVLVRRHSWQPVLLFNF